MERRLTTPRRATTTANIRAIEVADIQTVRRNPVITLTPEVRNEMESYLERRGALPSNWDTRSDRTRFNTFAWTLLKNTGRTSLSAREFSQLSDQAWLGRWARQGDAALQDVHRRECNWVCRNKGVLTTGLSVVIVGGVGVATGGAAAGFAGAAGFTAFETSVIAGTAGGLGSSLAAQSLTGNYSLSRTVRETAVGGLLGAAAYGLGQLGMTSAPNVTQSATGASHSPRFVAHSNGEIVPVPAGASGPVPVRTGNGMQFTGGSGGFGLDPKVTGIRIMEPVTTGKYTYPQGYLTYMNSLGQTVNPGTGQTILRSDPLAHWPWSSG
jgi:hypothetical protein